MMESSGTKQQWWLHNTVNVLNITKCHLIVHFKIIKKLTFTSRVFYHDKNKLNGAPVWHCWPPEADRTLRPPFLGDAAEGKAGTDSSRHLLALPPKTTETWHCPYCRETELDPGVLSFINSMMPKICFRMTQDGDRAGGRQRVRGDVSNSSLAVGRAWRKLAGGCAEMYHDILSTSVHLWSHLGPIR